MNRIFYCTKKDYNFSFLFKELTELYLPIIGSEAYSLYMYLFNSLNNISKIDNISQNLNDIILFINSDFNKFETSRKVLEAIGLIETYKNNINNQITYVFVLKKIKTFPEIDSIFQFKQLLIKKIGNTNYEYLQFVNKNISTNSFGNNITSLFSSVFKLEHEEIFDFQNLYSHISKIMHKPLILEEKSKNLIINITKKFNISKQIIKESLLVSLIVSENYCTVNNDLFEDSILKNIGINNNNNYIDIEINRNNDLFLNKLDIESKNKIFFDYKTRNSENYLQSIIKHELDDQQRKTINTLKTKYILSDEIINILIDFTLFKTNGKLNQKYIYKIAETINCLNIKKLEDILIHFVSFNNGTSKQIQNSYRISKKDNDMKEI